MNAEFDKYSSEYERLLHDPIRERFAPGSHFFHERKWLLLRDWFSRAGLDAPRLSWLDVGCGKGELLRLGRPHVGRAVGCDLSEKMIETIDDLEVHHQKAPDRLPFEDAALDVVTAVCVYHHVEPSLRPALCSEVRRVLRPGGVFGIIEHNPYNPLTQLIVHRTPVDADAQLLTARKTRRLMRSAGFEGCATQYFLFLPGSLFHKLAMIEHMCCRLPLGGQFAVFGKKV
jgi:SAM-dependent methyltransferase